MKQEVWRDTEYQNYQVSNLGRVRHFERVLSDVQNAHRYNSIIVSGGKRVYTHRLVAMAFIPIVNGRTEVNHINGDTKDNRVTNLEWIDHKSNMIHAKNILKRWEEQAKRQRKKVLCVELNKSFDSMKEACEFLGDYKGKGGGIGIAIKTNTRALGFHWKYI